ncbi:hypothetical protein KW785_02420 [Candidatus Parcubacteria bacterium]|nr:hypothetical protein [Candidatus Parcubacteria bacterium]
MIRIKHALATLPLSLALLAGSFAGVANAQTYLQSSVSSPMLAVQLMTNGLSQNVGAGSQNATLAVVRLDTTYSGEDVRISSIPLILGTGNGATGASLQNCTIANANNTSSALNSGNNVPSSINSGLNSFTLDNPLVLPRGTVTTLNLMCNIGSGAVNGGTYTFSLNTANVVATGATSGQPAVVTVGTSVPNTGGTGTVGNGTGTVYPGVPNTGAGGNAARNIALILGSLFTAALGLFYSRRYAR